MKEWLQQFKVIQPTPVSGQIQDYVRELIRSGKLTPGERLPSTEELARSWETHVPTVHKALTKLVAEGILKRHHGKGTFVAQREAKLTCVGVSNTATNYGGSLFLQALHTALKEELARLDIEMDVWLDPRSQTADEQPWLPLVKAAEHREFQALIVTNTNPRRLPWQQRLPVPTAFLSSADLPECVGCDLDQMVEVSLRALVAQGCRSVGLILQANPGYTHTPGDRSYWVDFSDRFLGLAGELGLAIRNEWLRLSKLADDDPAQPPSEEFGYQEFRQLWRQPERPEGLIVWPDTAARGVIAGALEQRVRVPDELRLVLHKNEAVVLFCPLPATLVVSSERAMARALIGQVQKQLRGEPCERILVGFHAEDNRPGS